jgi:two-component system response regulator RegX3
MSIRIAETLDGRPPVHGRSPSGGSLALADRGPVVELCRLAGIERVTPADGPLGHLIATARPRLLVVASPPASPADIALIASERRRRPSMRAVLINEPAAVSERLDALALGFDEALPGDLAMEELLGRVRLLASPPNRSTVLVVADGVELDLASHEVRRDGRVIHVRPKEFSLLALMASHPGRVYTRRQLLERVWGPDAASDPRTVDVHVRWLRSKIEPDPEHPVHLVTVRGIGYRLDPVPSLTVT